MIVFMLLFFAVFFILLMSTVNTFNSYSFNIAIYADGKSIEELEFVDIIKDNISDNDIIYVDNVENGHDLLKHNKAGLFVVINTTVTPEEIIVYYDNSSVAGAMIKEEVAKQKDEYAFKMVSQFLEEYGVEINKDYFYMVDFIAENNVKPVQQPFSQELTVSIYLIIMLGLVYSISKDNETNVAKNILYLPIGVNKYLFSKIIPYVILGMLQVLAVLLLGGGLFGIGFQTNILLIALLSIVFILSTIMLGLVFSNLKNQISAVFCLILVALVSIFAFSTLYVPGLPFLFKAILYSMPIVPYIILLNGMMFNGVILWEFVLYLTIQVIVYYLISFFIVKRKTKN